MSDRAIVSVSFYPRYRHAYRCADPAVISATRRTLYDNGTYEIETISADEFEQATGMEIAALCDGLDRHPRGTA